MKKYFKVIMWIAIGFVGLIIILSVIGLFIGDQTKVQVNTSKTTLNKKIRFTSKEFAYFKSPKRFRVFIYYVTDTNWTRIRAIGDGLMHTDGRPTVAFFYTNRNLLTQISGLKTFYDALRFGYSEGCVAEYWKQPRGDVVFKKFPKEDFR